MHRPLPFLFSLALVAAGCATDRAPVRTVNVPRIVNPMPRTAVASAAAAAPQPMKPITLAWDNPNPSAWPLVTEFHSTTDLLQPFRFKCNVPPGVYTLTLQPTNAAEYFICRFVDPLTGEVSGWNVK